MMYFYTLHGLQGEECGVEEGRGAWRKGVVRGGSARKGQYRSNTGPRR